MESNTKLQFEQVKNDAQQLSRSIGALVSDGKTAERAREEWQHAKSTMRHKQQEADTYVHEHPWQSVAVAAAVAAVVGMMFGRKR